MQVYPDRVAFCVAQLCPVYCRYCFRKRRDDESGLHFNRKIVDRGIEYIASMPAIRDVLITGGDPFIASDGALENLLERLRAIPHVEIIRFGTRTPVTLPYRVTAKLAKMISQFHPVWVNTHFNCAEELTPEAVRAVANLVDHGIPVGNQAVLLRGINDSTERLLALFRGLLKARVRPYYLFHPHLVEGTEHLRVGVDEGLRLMQSLRGNITGMGIPTYIVDTPSGKVPLMPDAVLARDGQDLLLSDVRGQIWREKAAFMDTAATDRVGMQGRPATMSAPTTETEASRAMTIGALVRRDLRAPFFAARPPWPPCCKRCAKMSRHQVTGTPLPAVPHDAASNVFEYDYGYGVFIASSHGCELISALDLIRSQAQMSFANLSLKD